MSANERRQELAQLIAIGLARAIAIRVGPAAESAEPEEPGVHGFALSATSRRSVHTGEASARNDSKAGERMTANTKENVNKQIASLDRTPVRELQDRYAEVSDEPTQFGNRQGFLRRVAWLILMLAKGDLATRVRRWRALAEDGGGLGHGHGR